MITDPNLLHTAPMKRSNFFLPEQITAELAALSKRTGVSMSEHLRNALVQYLKAQRKDAEKKNPEQDV